MDKKQVSVQDTNSSTAHHVLKVTLGANFTLAAVKLLAGIIAHSSAMISDAINSITDVFSTFLAMIGVSLADKESDHEHEYGHERLECVVSLVLSIILLGTGLTIGWTGVNRIIENIQGINVAGSSEIPVPGVLALVAAVFSIVVKEVLYVYTIAIAKKINSVVLKANAWDHQSDVLSSIGSFIGILASRIGYPIMDPIASVVICLFIIKASISIFRESVDKMVDKSCDKETEEKIKDLIIAQKGVIHIDRLQTRLFGSKIYVDVEITAEGSQSLNDAHAIAENIHEAIENGFSGVKHCMVHVNPDTETVHDL